MARGGRNWEVDQEKKTSGAQQAMFAVPCGTFSAITLRFTGITRFRNVSKHDINALSKAHLSIFRDEIKHGGILPCKRIQRVFTIYYYVMS
jgi:hypothetical protein